MQEKGIKMKLMIIVIILPNSQTTNLQERRRTTKRYIITMEKKAKSKQERACAKCKYHFRGWDIDVGPCQMCRRLQSEEYDLVCGGTRFVGPLLKCEEERGIKRGVRKRLWIGSDICGNDGRYWVEK